MRSWCEFSPKLCPAQFWAGSGGSPDFTWGVGSLVISIDVGCCGSRSSRTLHEFFRKRRCLVLNAWLRPIYRSGQGRLRNPRLDLGAGTLHDLPLKTTRCRGGLS